MILKNGVLFSYKTSLGSIPSDYTENMGPLAGFRIDVNGNDKPNIGGRDFFAFYIDSKGYIQDYGTVQKGTNYSLEQKKTSCKSNYFYCYGALVDNGWKIDY